MQEIQYYYAAYAHIGQAAEYYAAKYDQPAQQQAAPAEYQEE
jgi:hypothetical protein